MNKYYKKYKKKFLPSIQSISFETVIRTSQIITIYMIEQICNNEFQGQEESLLSLHIRPISCATIDGLA